ncbi:hypothetical protein B0H19DRAFT_1065513 [Mycena capillaripes]|nr:hypothetical protein B0H19DRAFT_1065513 [Mycena capillaripes]
MTDKTVAMEISGYIRFPGRLLIRVTAEGPPAPGLKIPAKMASNLSDVISLAKHIRRNPIDSAKLQSFWGVLSVSCQCTAGWSGFFGHHFSSMQTSHTFHALHAAVEAARTFFFAHQSFSLDLAALLLTRFLTKFKIDFRMRLGATQKSRVGLVRLVRLLCKLSIAQSRAENIF